MKNAIAIVLIALAASPLSAAITTSTVTGDGTASTTDLLQTSLGSEASTGIVGVDSNPAVSVLRNGTVSTAISTGTRIMASTGDTITWTLDLAGAPLGYDLTQIDVYTHWQNDSGASPDRASQDYAVFVAPYDAVTTFSALYTVNVDGNGTIVRVRAVDLDDGLLAERVGAIRFAFAAGPLGNNAYREIDVIGVASVPAPAALPAGLGLIGLAAMRRRRR